MSRNRATRRQDRHTKGMRRLREDRAQHGADRGCSCFEHQAGQGKGLIFARFADHPQICSYATCCGNPRAMEGPTRQEKKAPTVKDWL